MERLSFNYKDESGMRKMVKWLLNADFDKNTVIVCIGTDLCIGDSLGPIVGTMLKEANISLNVYGTLESPIHAKNVEERMNEIKENHKGYKILAVDACLGSPEDIGNINLRELPIFPGKGAGKTLPSVGDASIIGIVDQVEGDIFSLRKIRLNFVMNMAKTISKALIKFDTYFR